MFIGGALGILGTGIAGSLQARVKLREVETTYRQRLQDAYLANARLHTHRVYVPLARALSRLDRAYYTMAPHIDPVTHIVDPVALQEFRAACQRYVNDVDQLEEQGAFAFITPQLDEQLTSFTSFVRESDATTDTVVRSSLDNRQHDLAVRVDGHLIFSNVAADDRPLGKTLGPPECSLGSRPVN